MACDRHFSRNGLDAPLIEVIRELGIGNGTLYRHYASQHAIFAALYDRFVQALQGIADRTEAAPTGWDALQTYLDDTSRLLEDHPYLPELLQRIRGVLPDAHRGGSRFAAPIERLVERATAEGTLRPDVTAADIAMVPFTLFSASMMYPEELRDSFRGRMRGILTDGLTPPSATPLGAVSRQGDAAGTPKHPQR